MYRSLNTETLGVTGRQSELIELALSNRFKGLDIDIELFSRQVEKNGLEYAARCLESAKKCTGLEIGAWELPIRWQEPDDTFQEQLNLLPTLASTAKSIGATRCVTTVMAGHEVLPLKENFDFHDARFTEIAERLAPHGISLGLGFQAAAKAHQGLEHQFIVSADTLVTLIQMVNADNIGLHLDTWEWHLGSGTFDQLEKLGPNKIVAVRVADVPVGATVDSIELTQRLLPEVEGVVPNAEILNRLHEMGFDGPVTSYPDPSQCKETPRDKIVRRVADGLRSVWPSAELLREAAAEAEEQTQHENANGWTRRGVPAST